MAGKNEKKPVGNGKTKPEQKPADKSKKPTKKMPKPVLRVD